MMACFLKTLALGLSLRISGRRLYASWMRLHARSLNSFRVDMTTASTFLVYLLSVILVHGVDDPEKNRLVCCGEQ